MYSNISEATSFKNRSFRIVKALPYGIIVIEFIWFLLNPQMADDQNYSSTGMLASFMASTILLMPLVPITMGGPKDLKRKLLTFIWLTTTISAILFIINAATFNTTTNPQIGLTITVIVYSLLFGIPIAFFTVKFCYIVIKFFVIEFASTITHGLKWFSWNGYSDKFIAITRKGNIKRFNNLSSIVETLSQNASSQEILSTFERYPQQIKAAKKKHPTW